MQLNFVDTMLLVKHSTSEPSNEKRRDGVKLHGLDGLFSVVKNGALHCLAMF